MKKTNEPKRCFNCGNGHVEMHPEKAKVNGELKDICKGCFDEYANKD